MEKKKHRKHWVILLVLILLIGAGFWAGKSLWEAFWSPRLPVSAVVQDEDGEVEQDAVILFAAQNEFQVGIPGNTELTVLCQEDVTGPVTITDDQGMELAVLENDGSGQLQTTVEIFEETPRYGQLQASAGEEISAPVSFYVIPEITEEMAGRLLEVCTDLGDYTEQAGFEDPFSEDALEDISAWLEADERVQAVKPAGNGLLFATTDSLIGSYGLNRTSPNTFGYVNEDQAFAAYQEGQSTEELYIPSEIPRTNSHILHLSPYSNDEAVQRFGRFFRESEDKLVERVGGILTWSESEDAINKLVNGEFTSYGMTVLNTHGGLIERKDGSDMLFMAMGERTKAQIWELMDLLDYTQLHQAITPLEDGYYSNVWGMIDDTGSIRWIVDVTIDPTGHAAYHLNMTSSYLECALSDQVFDNTILYFAVCKAKSDDQMVQLLHRHGASAFIGCRENLDIGLSIAFLEQLAEVMGTPANEYSFGTLGNVSGYVLRSVDDYIRTSVYTEQQDYQDYRAALSERPLRYSYLNDSANRVFAGHGAVQGKVLDQDLNETEGAAVTFYRWLNHEFQEEWNGTTNAEGAFTVPEVPYGVYGIYAEKDGASGFTTAVLDDGSKTLETKDIVLDWTGAENNGGNVVRYRGNIYYWKYNTESFDSNGTFAYYPHRQTENQLICRHKDGSEDLLLSAKGYGPIFIVGDRIYLKENGADLFSVNLDGSGRVDHGYFEPWAADDSAGTLIGRYNGGVYLLYAKDHSTKQVHSTGQTYLGTVDGYCYYSTAGGQEVPQATLWKAAVDGSEVVELSRVSGSEEWAAAGFNICQVVKAGDRIYYSYGCYAGTGFFFQEGGVNCVDTDGANTQVIVEYGQLGAEEFQVVESGGETCLYYIGTDDAMGSYVGFWDDYPYTSCHVMIRNSGEETWTAAQSDSRISKPGSFVCINGEILRHQEGQISYQTLIPQEAGFEFLDNPQGSEDKIALVSDLDIIGDDLYFTVEWSVRAEESFGWRPIYNRERSVFYTMKIGESEPVALYEY